MAEKTIKVSDELYAILESLRKEDETLEMVLIRLLPTKNKRGFFR
jgi:predicted CopG family antitoxin